LRNSSHHCTIRMTSEKFSEISEVARSKECTPSEIIRRAVDLYLYSQSLVTESQLRLVRVGEYSQLALDTIICEQFPDFRDKIVAATDKRMKRYHGQD
jgi:hypothetical protein